MSRFQILFASVLVIGFCIFGSTATAEGKWFSWSGRKKKVHTVSSGYRIVLVDGVKYYYRRGVFYKNSSRGYLAVSAPYGAVLDILPEGRCRIQAAGTVFYYHAGTFYKRKGKKYIVARAPLGAVFATLPVHSTVLVLGGRTYHYHCGIYFVKTDDRYVVVRPPMFDPPRTTAVDTALEKRTQTVMVHNSNGSRTPVLLTALGENEWQGPRGEIYSSFPTEQQLLQAYGF